MPTYDYACDACQHTFEAFESIIAQPQKKCPRCKKPKLRRLLGVGGGLVFKGSGFYQTDYRSEAYKRAAAADSATSNGTNSSQSGGNGSATSSKSKAAAE